MYHRPRFPFFGAALFFGALIFFAPPLLLAVAIGFLAFRFWGFRRFRRHGVAAFADKVRHMGDAEYELFQERLSMPCRHWRNQRRESEFV